nr:hypothetical protein [Mucilaginibacter sp. X4EP1]
MLVFDETKRKKQNLVILLCTIYLFFACFYVVLCQRNNNAILLFGNTTSIQQKPVIAPWTKANSSLKFFSRPRVVVNRLSAVTGVLAAIGCFLLFITAPAIYKTSLGDTPFCFHTKYTLRYLHVWRI